MAMSASVLGPALKAAMDGLSDPTDRDELFEALAQAIITHITTSATIVTSTGGASPGAAVLPGTAIIT